MTAFADLSGGGDPKQHRFPEAPQRRSETTACTATTPKSPLNFASENVLASQQIRQRRRQEGTDPQCHSNELMDRVNQENAGERTAPLASIDYIIGRSNASICISRPPLCRPPRASTAKAK